MPRPVGTITRGTTAPNRLRRVDRWLLGTHARVLRSAVDPLVVDLGYGAHPVTTVELFERVRRVRPDASVLGLEIDPQRVAAALALARPGLSFGLGGFELPLDGRRPVVIRALNVLRQYDEVVVPGVWDQLTSRLAARGVVIEGTCDEIGRRAAWVALGADGPQTLTLAAHLGSLGRPGELAQRLPKALIHRNVPGEPVHAFLAALDDAWSRAAPLSPYGARHRWVAAVEAVATGWPVVGNRARWRLGEVTVDWRAVAPSGGRS